MKEQFKNLDRMVFRLERMFVVVALAIMSVVVFLDVVHRSFAGDENKGVSAFVKFLSYFGTQIERGSPAYASLEQWFPYLLWAGFVGLGFLALRTAGTTSKVPVARAFVFSAVGVIVVYGLIRLFVILLPNGLFWSQKLALVLTLWVGFVAASMCAHENKHLKVEAAQRLIPARLKPVVVFASATFTAVVCFSLMWLAARYVTSNYEDFVKTDGAGGVFKGLGVAKYKCFAVLPLSFAMMGIRFTARGLFALGGELPQDPQLEGLDALESDDQDARPPSEVPTDMAGLLVADSNLPPSRVPTDRQAARPRPSSDSDPGEEEEPSQTAAHGEVSDAEESER